MEITNIIETLKKQPDELYVDNAFELFINNQISVKELDEILKAHDYHLPEEFFSLRVDLQKLYRQTNHFEIILDKDCNFVDLQSYRIYNYYFFYELLEKSKRNKEATKQFIDYVLDLEDTSIYLIASRVIKVKNINYFVTKSDIMKFMEVNDISSLYELLTKVSELKLSEEKSKLQNIINNYFINELCLFTKDDITQNSEHYCFNKLAFLVDNVLDSLDRKIANTIKVKFLAYNPAYLKESDYFETDSSNLSLIKKYASKLSDIKIKKVIDFVYKNKSVIDSLPPNGHYAIYLSLMEATYE